MKKAGETRVLRALPSGDPPVPWRKRKLTTIEHVRAYVGSIINRVEAGTLDDAKGARLGNLCNILVGIIKESDLETRLAALEKAAKEKGHV